jgi:hypothetical protein
MVVGGILKLLGRRSRAGNHPPTCSLVGYPHLQKRVRVKVKVKGKVKRRNREPLDPLL